MGSFWLTGLSYTLGLYLVEGGTAVEGGKKPSMHMWKVFEKKVLWSAPKRVK
jgi:hypothetical protein